jgi:hypothetical protein
MREIEEGTLSHGFRKGEMNNTVTVGYIGMANCSGWSVSLEWQDYMFKEMNNGSTIKESFDLASANYPTIAECVRFVGDENLKVRNHPTITKLEGPSNGYAGVSYNYTFSSNDIDRDELFYYVDFGDGDILEWIGPYACGKNVTKDHIFSEQGEYNISVRVKDSSGLESELEILKVNMPKSKNKIINNMFFKFLKNHPNLFTLLRQILNLL